MNLDEYLEEDLGFEERIHYWNAISSALCYAHSKEVWHGDLHLQNIMVDKHWLKIIDFANSSFLGSREWVLSMASDNIKTLVNILFTSKNLADFVTIDLTDMHPDFTLGGCIAWVEFLVCERYLILQRHLDFLGAKQAPYQYHKRGF